MTLETFAASVLSVIQTMLNDQKSNVTSANASHDTVLTCLTNLVIHTAENLGEGFVNSLGYTINKSATQTPGAVPSNDPAPAAVDAATPDAA